MRGNAENALNNVGTKKRPYQRGCGTSSIEGGAFEKLDIVDGNMIQGGAVWKEGECHHSIFLKTSLGVRNGVLLWGLDRPVVIGVRSEYILADPEKGRSIHKRGRK